MDALEPVREGQVAPCNEAEDVSDQAPHIRAVGRVERLQCRLIERHDVPDDEADPGPVELPNRVLVGTSTNGDLRPPVTLPNWSSDMGRH